MKPVSELPWEPLLEQGGITFSAGIRNIWTRRVPDNEIWYIEHISTIDATSGGAGSNAHLQIENNGIARSIDYKTNVTAGYPAATDMKGWVLPKDRAGALWVSVNNGDKVTLLVTGKRYIRNR